MMCLYHGSRVILDQGFDDLRRLIPCFSFLGSWSFRCQYRLSLVRI